MAAANAANSPTFARPRTRTFMWASAAKVGFFELLLARLLNRPVTTHGAAPLCRLSVGCGGGGYPSPGW